VDDLNSEWQRKGGTLSDKTARKEFGLTQDEIVSVPLIWSYSQAPSQVNEAPVFVGRTFT
jgi:hypothetical protein